LADPNSEIILEFKVLNVEAAGKDKGMAHPGFFYLDANGIIREKYFQEKDTERFTANNVVGKLFPELSDEVTKTVDAPHVKLTLEQSDSEVISGNRISLAAEIELPKGVHVYAPGVQGYRPIELRLNPASGVEFRPVTYPSPRVLYLEAIQEHVPVFEGKFRISQDATVKESTTREVVRSLVAADRVVVITGELAYQACDDKVCYPPATVPVEWRVKVNPLDLKIRSGGAEHARHPLPAILGIDLDRIHILSSRMRKATCMHHLRPADIIFVHGVPICLQETIELAKELLRPFPFASHAEVKNYGISGRSVLPQISLMILAALVVHLHAHRRFIGLDITSIK